jgi:hypothetical protein
MKPNETLVILLDDAYANNSDLPDKVSPANAKQIIKLSRKAYCELTEKQDATLNWVKRWSVE